MSWTPSTRRGTRRVQPVLGTVDKQLCQPVTVTTLTGNLIIALDRVYMQHGSDVIWSTEKAKFRQWQARYQLTETDAAALGQVQHDHAMAALNLGAQLQAWPYLMDIMDTHALDVVVGPSVFEAPPYTSWCTPTETFAWEAGQRPLILLDWIPTESLSSILERAREEGPFVVLGKRPILDDESLAWLNDMHSDVANLEGQRFVYKSQWWRTGNKAIRTCDPITVWTLEPDLTLPLSD
eukprot:3933905-Rhodomonas_salina.2